MVSHLPKPEKVHIPIHSFHTAAFPNGEAIPEELDTAYLEAKFAAFPESGALSQSLEPN